MAVDEIKRHREALRARQQILLEMDDELAMIHASYQQLLKEHYERKAEKLRHLAYYGLPTPANISNRLMSSARHGKE